MRRRLKLAALGLAVVLAALGLVVAWVLSWPDFGGALEGERLARAKRSKQWRDGAFANEPPPPASDLAVNLKEMMGDEVRSPPGPLPLVTPSLAQPAPPGLRATWFGHATVLVELDGRRVLTDPMLSDHAFPVKALAPVRSTRPPVALDQLPPIDVVTVSHDHFDHLDMPTVQALAKRGTHFFVGLGVGAHLEQLGRAGAAAARAGLVGVRRARGAENPLHAGAALLGPQVDGEPDPVGVVGHRGRRAPRLSQR